MQEPRPSSLQALLELLLPGLLRIRQGIASRSGWLGQRTASDRQHAHMHLVLDPCSVEVGQAEELSEKRVTRAAVSSCSTLVDAFNPVIKNSLLGACCDLKIDPVLPGSQKCLSVSWQQACFRYLPDRLWHHNPELGIKHGP